MNVMLDCSMNISEIVEAQPARSESITPFGGTSGLVPRCLRKTSER